VGFQSNRDRCRAPLLIDVLGYNRNHPVIKEDALLSTFLVEPSFEQWRKHSSISLEEESASKRIDRLEEMTIPSDLEDKLGYPPYLPSYILFD
jgi:hypothetical protein